MNHRQKMHVNSLAAWHNGNESLFSKREILVLRAFANFRAHATDREIMVACGFSDMNSVRPRITELVKDGVLEEVSTREDPVTRKPVRVCRVRKNPDRNEVQVVFNLGEVLTVEAVANLQRKASA